ncbi:MAG: hypothetical protein PHF97_00070 [Bacteroidales bacterium]|nr:hypothetical protein [Bacteroidales bacterium]
MIKSYFKTAIAHLIRNKTYSLISILSLTIGFQSYRAATVNPVETLKSE